MKSILEELWYENICPRNVCCKASEEEKKLIGYIADHHKNLWETLTDKQRDMFERFDECHAELTEREIFTYAFRLGARIPFEIMSFRVE